MRFFLKISVLNYVSEGGVNLFILTPEKAAFTVVNRLNQSIMFCREAAVV